MTHMLLHEDFIICDTCATVLPPTMMNRKHRSANRRCIPQEAQLPRSGNNRSTPIQSAIDRLKPPSVSCLPNMSSQLGACTQKTAHSRLQMTLPSQWYYSCDDDDDDDDGIIHVMMMMMMTTVITTVTTTISIATAITLVHLPVPLLLLLVLLLLLLFLFLLLLLLLSVATMITFLAKQPAAWASRRSSEASRRLGEPPCRIRIVQRGLRGLGLGRCDNECWAMDMIGACRLLI